MCDAEILIVEDDPVVAMDLESSVKQMGFRTVGTVSSGEEALARCAEGCPDLVVMDIRLAGEIDGIETSSRIQEIHPVPVIFLTAYADEQLFERAAAEGPFSYLLKPCTTFELRNCIRLALEKSALESDLRMTRESFQNIVEKNADGILIVDKTDGTIRYANGSAGTVFDPYYTTKSVGEGSGLGLSVVKGIVESHGGSLAVESEQGQGSTFLIFLPLSPGETENTEDSLPVSCENGHGRVLLVDDEESLLDLGRQMLEDLGYEVVTETAAERALRRFTEDPGGIDLVITDQGMPGMSGTDLAARMLEVRSDLPIVLYTGYGEVLTQEKAMQLGIRALLRKPLHLEEIAKVVSSLLG